MKFCHWPACTALATHQLENGLGYCAKHLLIVYDLQAWLYWYANSRKAA
jgi:hypothetical protein